jgi:hypothetical protein
MIRFVFVLEGIWIKAHSKNYYARTAMPEKLGIGEYYQGKEGKGTLYASGSLGSAEALDTCNRPKHTALHPHRNDGM